MMIGPFACPRCEGSVIAAFDDRGQKLIVNYHPAPGGPIELFAEYFPSGDLVEDVVRMRERPAWRPESSPAWWPHICEETR